MMEKNTLRQCGFYVFALSLQHKNNTAMRNTIASLIALFFLPLGLIAQEWIPIQSQQPEAPVVKLISSTDQESTVTFNLSGFQKTPIQTPNGLQYSIIVPQMASMLQEGAPDLPLFAIPMLIGNDAAMEVTVKQAQYQDYKDISIIPSKGNLNRQVDPDKIPYRYGEVYHQNRFFPESTATLDAPYILRDCRGQNILVYPFAYNPITKTLRVFTQITLTMRMTGELGDNRKVTSRLTKKIAPETEALYSHRFINYKAMAAKYPFLPDTGEMLVICPDQYMEAMQPYVEWKNISGRPTTIVSLSEVGGNNDNTIKDYIHNYYDNPEHNLTYVLLVGDYADLTPHSMSGGRSDIWFGQLEGNDYYPEVFVGRFSVESVAHVQNHVAKVLYYERDMPSTVTWVNHGIGIGSTEGAGSGHNGGESDYQHIDFIRDTLLHYTYESVSQHYHGVGVGTNAAMLSEDFNNGASICNYCNHGSATSWYVGSFNNNHVNALVNDYKWPVIWSTACLNGQFNTTCFAEAWMRATNNNTGAPTGAIGGMFSWTNQPWQPPMTGQDEMVNVLCEWRNADQYHHTLAGASLNGNMKILDLHPSDQGATHNTWILFGDPSLVLRTDNPTEMNVACQPEAIFLGQSELVVTANADYAIATLSINGQVLSSTPIVSGEGTLHFTALEEEGTAQLVVMGFNKVTEVRDIEVIPANGAYITYESFSINDGNHQADYGETIGLDLTVKNLGNSGASNIQVTLSSDSPWVVVTQGEALIPSINAMGHYTINNGFEISIDDAVADGTQADFTLVCSDGSNTWTSRFRMTLHAPLLALAEFLPTGTAHPGETCTLSLGIKNIGSSDAHNAQVQLFSSTTDLVFNPDIYSLGDIDAGATTTVTASFSTDAQVPNGSSFEVYYRADAGHYALDGIEFLNIGPVKETFETGDFSAFDWETLGGAYWYVDNTTAHTGTYSARSGAITHVNVTTLQISVDVAENGEISFYKKVCTEANKDKLTFYIDNTAMGEWSGEVDWSREHFPVTAGTHKFKWIYLKDSNGSYGDDCCWIDDVQFPSSNTITLLPALQLEGYANMNQVNLQWQPLSPDDNYIIRRDGEIIATQHGNYFIEYLDLGVYTYSVTAVSPQGQQSIPAYKTIEINIVNVDENICDAQLYPNPVHGNLNISLGRPFHYALFNSMGQLVKNGTCSGNDQISCNGLPGGMYFLQISTDTQTCIRKILVY